MEWVYHFSPLCKLPRQRGMGYADRDGKKGPPAISTCPITALHRTLQRCPWAEHNSGEVPSVTRTRKDSTQNPKTVLEVVKRDDGTFDLFLNRALDRSQISERLLPEELCVRFGFCGEEYRVILGEIDRNGRATLPF